MISLSWSLIILSICSMRFSIPATTESLPTVMTSSKAPLSSTWLAYSESSESANWRWESSRTILPWCRKRSGKGNSANAVPAACGVGSAMLFTSIVGSLELLQFVGFSGCVSQHLVKSVVAVELGQQIVEAGAGFKQFGQGFDLGNDSAKPFFLVVTQNGTAGIERKKIVDVLELEFDVHLSAF